jgi:hypothetical protein
MHSLGAMAIIVSWKGQKKDVESAKENNSGDAKKTRISVFENDQGSRK